MPLAVMQRSTSPRGPIALSKDDEDAKPKAQGGTALVQHPTHLKEGPPRLPQVVGLQYRVLQRLGEGSFGIIHVGQCTLTRKFVAIKFESAAPTNRLFDDSDRNNISGQQQRQLPDEYRNYQTLNSASSDGCPWFPMTYFFGVQDGCWALVMDLEGPSLETLFERHHRLLPMGIVARLAVQMITLMEGVHQGGLVYRDVKPDNFLLRLRDSDQQLLCPREMEETEGCADVKPVALALTMIDFGMAKPYRDAHGRHIAYRERRTLSGTARYMSINSHYGREQSRRDDLESLGHVFFYLARGSLPWQGLKAPSHRDKCERIAACKQATTLGELCEDGRVPFEFGQYLAYCRNLQFAETPDYARCRRFFYKVLHDCKSASDADLDLPSLRREFLVKYTGQPGASALLTRDNCRRLSTTYTLPLSHRRRRPHHANEGNEAYGDNNDEAYDGTEESDKGPKRPSWWRRLLCLS